MGKRTAFIGHRHIFKDSLREKLFSTIEKEIQNGCIFFTMGTHGDFDFFDSLCVQRIA